MKFPPCKICKHSKSKHGKVETSTYVGWHKRRKMVESLRCTDCYNLHWFGPTYEWEYEFDATNIEWGHEYQGDNLALLELKSRRHDMTNGVR